MSVLLTSDLHLGHDMAAELRGFHDVDTHDEFIINLLKGQCDKRTVLWILGDVAMRQEKLPLLAEIPGRKILVRGNHDKYQISRYLKYFEEVHGIIKKYNFWLSHCPIHPQEIYRCRANIHGHIHKNAATPELPDPYYNVNWDFWSQAVSLDKIRQDLGMFEYGYRKELDNGQGQHGHESGTGKS